MDNPAHLFHIPISTISQYTMDLYRMELVLLPVLLDIPTVMEFVGPMMRV
jgi:hypothetical protein